jgi:hypothetical protein
MTLVILPERAAITPCEAPGIDPDIWFPEPTNKRAIAQAVELCAACPVRAACLEYALDNNIGFGVWGGLTANRRSKLPRRHPCRYCQEPCPTRRAYCGDACHTAARLSIRKRYERGRKIGRAA